MPMLNVINNWLSPTLIEVSATLLRKRLAKTAAAA